MKAKSIKGVTIEEINEELDTNYTTLDYESAQRTNSTNQSGVQSNN